MPKFQAPSDELIKKFDSILKKTSIVDLIQFRILDSPSLKEPIMIAKASPIVNHLNSIDVLLYFNEELFDMLDESLQDIAIEEKLAQVYFDSEKDKVVMLKPDLTTFSGIIGKYGDEYFRLFESIKAMKQQKEEKAKEEKLSAKPKKGKKF